MSTYKIITDSACDLPKSMLQELDISAVSLTVNFRGETRCDSVEDGEVKELYAAMRSAPAPPPPPPPSTPTAGQARSRKPWPQARTLWS